MKEPSHLQETLLAKLPPVWERRHQTKKSESAAKLPTAPIPKVEDAKKPESAAGASALGKSGRFGALAAMMDAEVSQLTKSADQK